MSAQVSRDRGPVVALSGGVGGAKLALGLSRVLPPNRLLVVANTGDDFDHLGLRICPDIDTLMYALSGLDDKQRGWGRADETWRFMAALGTLGGETWFQLGDADLATHVERTRRLRNGEPLSDITADFCRRIGIPARIVPMTDADVRTKVMAAGAWIDFQDYFVRRRCEPVVQRLRFEGAEAAAPNAEFLAALADPALRAVILCPSNPFISIAPILALAGVREALHRTSAPVIAVSPIIGGRAVKGPTAKMMAELGMSSSAEGVALHYGSLVDVFVADLEDGGMQPPEGLRVEFRKTLMTTLADREALAREVLRIADEHSVVHPRRRSPSTSTVSGQ